MVDVEVEVEVEVEAPEVEIEIEAEAEVEAEVEVEVEVEVCRGGGEPNNSLPESQESGVNRTTELELRRQPSPPRKRMGICHPTIQSIIHPIIQSSNHQDSRNLRNCMNFRIFRNS